MLGCIWHIKAKAFINLVAANAAVIKALKVKEHALNHATGVLYRSQVTWAQAAVDFNQGFVSTASAVLFEGCFDVLCITIISCGK